VVNTHILHNKNRKTTQLDVFFKMVAVSLFFVWGKKFWNMPKVFLQTFTRRPICVKSPVTKKPQQRKNRERNISTFNEI
jgi:hypothetical protein